MRAVRACYIGTKKKPKEANFCQAEYKMDLKMWVKKGMSSMLRSDDDRDTWAGKFLPSIQDRCFIEFKNNGIFFVDDDGKELVVCCSDGQVNILKKYIIIFLILRKK
jgi:hypothetical protein